MTDPDRLLRRLIEQPGSPLERALLRAGSEVTVSEATRLAALEAVGLGNRRSGLVRVRSLVFGRASLLIAAMVISAAAVAIPLAQRKGDAESDSARAERLQSQVAEQVPRTPSGAVVPQVDELRIELPDAPADAQSARTNRTGDTHQRSSSNAAARNILAAELAALDAARGKLNAGDARSALMLLDAYQREFPKPRLALEAEVLRIDALDRSGQTETARKRAKAFVQSHPKGVLTGRVRRYLDK